MAPEKKPDKSKARHSLLELLRSLLRGLRQTIMHDGNLMHAEFSQAPNGDFH